MGRQNSLIALPLNNIIQNKKFKTRHRSNEVYFDNFNKISKHISKSEVFCSSFCLIILFLNFIYLLFFRETGREGERERHINV